MSPRLPAGVVSMVMLAVANAQEVRVALPQPLADLVVDALRVTLPENAGREVTARAVDPAALLEPEVARASILVADGTTLQRSVVVAALAQLPTDAAMPSAMRVTRDRRIALPWSLGYSICGDVANVSRRGPSEVTWEELALSYGLGDRLRVVPPEVDRGPWLLSMHETLRRGGGDSEVFGVWTALDARIAAYEADHAALAGAVARDQGLAVVLPTPVAATASFSALARLPLAGALPIGLCVTEGPGKDAAFSLLLEILAPSIELAVRERVGLSGAGIGDAEVPPDTVDPAFAHFAQRIRGQGRHAERVADWLDFAALGIMAVVLVVFLVRQRKGDPK